MRKTVSVGVLMSTIIEPALLDNICLAAPCNHNWNDMPVKERVRLCNTCSKNVFNISDLSSHHAKESLREHGVSKYLRISRRADGTFNNDNRSVDLRKVLNGVRWVSALIAGSILLCFAATPALAQNTEKGYVKEFSTDNGKDLVKEFTDTATQQPSTSATTAETSGGSVSKTEDLDDELKHQADINYKRKLLNAKLPQTFEIAIKYHQLGDLEKAIPFYKKVLTEDPKFESAYNNLALCLTERKAAGDLEEATELLSQSQKLSTTDGGVSDKSVDEKTIELPSTKVVNNSGTLFVQGQLSEQSGDLPAAIDCYLKALEQQKPLNLIIVKHLSELYVRTGNYNSARAILKRGILSAPPADNMRVLYQAITNLDNKSKPNRVE